MGLSDKDSPVFQKRRVWDKFHPKGNVMSPRLEKKLREVYENPTASEMLRIISLAGVFLGVYGFGYLMITLIEASPVYALKVAGILAIPFLILTILRRVINAPRPYEVLDFYETKPKGKRGKSFPSRHAYSVFGIGTVLLFFRPLFGVVVLAVGVMLAIARVLLGIHFPRDVIVGGTVGVIAGVIGMLIVNLI